MFFSPNERAQLGVALVFLGLVAEHAATPPLRQHLGARQQEKAYPRYFTKRWDLGKASANGGRHKTTQFYASGPSGDNK